VRGRREKENIQHKKDLDHAYEECRRLRQEAAAGLRGAADEAGTGHLDVALRHAKAALADLEAAKQACDHWKSLHPID
jgi:pyridoxal biosynthesis lyase PdxS